MGRMTLFAVAAASTALLALVACHRQGPYDKADGTFDRAAYRTHAMGQCRQTADAAGVIPEARRDSFCGCQIDAFLADSRDDELRAYVRSGEPRSTKIAELGGQCERRILSGPVGGGQSSLPPPPVPETGAGGAASSGVGRARPLANLASYITGDDYPASAARNNEQGRVAFTLTVGPAGQVTNCRIRATSGSAALDSATCRIMQSRARFTPARDAQGRPTTDTADATVLWRLEG